MTVDVRLNAILDPERAGGRPLTDLARAVVAGGAVVCGTAAALGSATRHWRRGQRRVRRRTDRVGQRANVLRTSGQLPHDA